jgi:hypothetical protein
MDRFAGRPDGIRVEHVPVSGKMEEFECHW